MGPNASILPVRLDAMVLTVCTDILYAAPAVARGHGGGGGSSVDEGSCPTGTAEICRLSYS